MREKPARESLPTPAAFINAQSAITGLRGRDLFSTLRSVAAHGLRNPVHSARHALKLGGQLGRVLLGETLHPTNPQDNRFRRPGVEPQPFLSPQLAGLPELAEAGQKLDRREQHEPGRSRPRALRVRLAQRRRVAVQQPAQSAGDQGDLQLRRQQPGARASAIWSTTSCTTTACPDKSPNKLSKSAKRSPPPPAPWCFAMNCWS